MRRCAGRALWSAILIGGLPAAALAGAGELPPVACVEALRLARVEGASRGATAERTRLEAALAQPGCELPALLALVARLPGPGESEEGLAPLRARLEARLENPAAEVPAGLLSAVARLPATDAQVESLLAALERRRAALAAGGRRLAAADDQELTRVAFELESRLERWPEARATLGRLLVLDGDESWRWRALELDQRLRRWEDLAADIEALLKNPSAPVAYLRPLQVTTLAHLGRFEEMVAAIERLPPEDPIPAESSTSPRTELLTEAAWALRDAGMDAEAESVFRRALAVRATHEEARAALLHLYGSAEERAAFAAATAARRAAEEDPQALYDEATALLVTGDAAAARELLARAAPALGGTVYAGAAWYNLGLAAFKLERWGEAADAFAEAGALEPQRVEIHYQLGIALHRAGRCAEAIAPLRRAAELQPERAATHYYLAECLEMNGERDAANRERELYRRTKSGG